MQDVNLRLEFHRAMDAVTPPAPWLGPRIREELRRRRQETFLERARRRPGEFAWLLPAVAVLLAVAIIVGALISHRLTVPLPLPVRPHAGAAAGCPTWGIVPGGPDVPSAVEMASLTVGWAPGALRTTDGGSTWHDVAPKALRNGEPYLPGQQTVYPPNYADFFLDADHGWLIRSYQTDEACTDHLTVFRTSDGGRTWHSSDVYAGNASSPVLSFFDRQHGWLLLTVPNPVSHPTPSTRARATSHTVVYRTADGGATWRLVSSAGPPCTALAFSSPTRGIAAGGGQFQSCQSTATTDDGGTTWSSGTLSNVGRVVFFDATHGVAAVYAGDSYGLYVTADGGRTWTQTASAQGGTTFAPGGFEPYALNVWFEDQRDFWLFTTQPGWNKGGLEHDWLYHSSDGGATWQLVQRDTPVSSPLSVSFVDPSHGFVLQTDVNGALVLVVTSDGGRTWTPKQVRVS